MNVGTAPLRNPTPRLIADPPDDDADDSPPSRERARTENPPRDDPNATEVTARLVLVVDDHVDTRGAYAEHLRMEGFRTAEAENGVVAIKLARELLPDVILLDY